MSRDDAEKLFVAMWRAGRAVDPKLYPPRMDNEPKESILAKIERGLDAHSAFLSVLRPDDDEVTPTAPDS